MRLENRHRRSKFGFTGLHTRRAVAALPWPMTDFPDTDCSRLHSETRTIAEVDGDDRSGLGTVSVTTTLARHVCYLLPLRLMLVPPAPYSVVVTV